MTFATAKFCAFLPAATLSMLAEFLVGFTDLALAGHLLGSDALAAINLQQPVVQVVSFLSFMVATGASVLFATVLGSFDERRAHELFTQGLVSAVGLGALMMLGLAFACRPVLASFGATPAVTALAETYWRAFLPCAVLAPASVYLANLCYADGDHRLCFVSYVAELVVNALVSLVLTWKLGIAGCAIGTACSYLASIAVLSLHFFRPGNNLRFIAHFAVRDTLHICWCAAGDASLKLCNAALYYLLNLYVVARFGTPALSVLAVVLAVLGFAAAFDGVSSAVQPLASVYIGERNDLRTKSSMTTAVKVALGESLAVTLVLVFAPGLAVRLVGLDDPALVAAASSAVRLVALGLSGTALMMLFNSYYTFLDRAGLAASLTIFTTFLVPVLLIPALGAVWKFKGVSLALGLAPLVAVSLAAFACACRWGRTRFPYLLDPARVAALRVFDLVLTPDAICSVSAAVADELKARGYAAAKASRAELLVEETLMVVRDRNAGRRIQAEVTVDCTEGAKLVLRDDGVLFDLTDADARISSLRGYLVSNLMTAIPNRRNLTTTGFNRNVFRL